MAASLTWRPSLVPHSTSAQAGGHPLATALAREMAERWQRGETPLAEEFLARHPELADDPEAAVQVIYEEVCLRQEAGHEVSPEDIFARFPQWRPQLEVLLECHRLLAPKSPVVFPEVGESLAGFDLIHELGRGAEGRVYLATQPALADRPVVVKITGIEGEEHLSLARLQHTHIVPLYGMHDDTTRQLRLLCMPYFGCATLSRLLELLTHTPAPRRTGKDLLDALDLCQAGIPHTEPLPGPARTLLGRATFAQAVAWLGACLADALQYAHERGLVHLDVKPSNVLLAADGQPMLLDFHLAQAPVTPDSPALEWLGGTPGFMSPEQADALARVREGRPPVSPVDGRSDIFSLGLLMYDALGGPDARPGEARPRLDRSNPRVSRGLADILARCLELDAAARYPDAGSLARDLRHHLTDKPLVGVPNRSLGERFRKWRRRRPYALKMMFLSVALVVGVGLLAAFGWASLSHQRQEAEQALIEGQEHLLNHDYSRAEDAFNQGLKAANRWPRREDLARQLEEQMGQVQRARVADRLHALAERLRFVVEPDAASAEQLQPLDEACAGLWQARTDLLAHLATGPGAEVEQRIKADLLDLAILWTDLRVRLGSKSREARRQALDVLDEAEELFGPSPVLDRERGLHARALGEEVPAAKGGEAQTSWEHYALGRSFLRADDLERAAGELNRAVLLEPRSFWANFYQGVCAYRRGQNQDGADAFGQCLLLAPDRAECHYNRALALAADGRREAALGHYSRALELEPGMASAALNRGLLYYQGKQYAEAKGDFENALAHGANPVVAHFNLALVHVALGQPVAARSHLRRVLEADPKHVRAKEMMERLKREERGRP